MRQNAFFSCLQETRMRRSKREEQKTDVCSDKRKIQRLEKKNHCFKFCSKNSYFLNLVIFAGNNQHFYLFEKLSNLRKKYSL